MSIADSPFPEMHLIGYIEQVIKDRTMTPTQKLKAIEAKIREYDADQKRRAEKYKNIER